MACTAPAESIRHVTPTKMMAVSATNAADPEPRAKQGMLDPITYTYSVHEPELESEDEDIPKRYYSRGCKCCEELEKTAAKAESDDEHYLRRDSGIKDEGLYLRFIRYFRMERQTGGFEIKCPPKLVGFLDGIYHRDHFKDYPNFDKMLNKSLRFVIETYNKKTGEQRELLQILNVTVSLFASMIFRITFECFEPAGQPTYTNIYQTVVAYDLVTPSHPISVLILRRKSDGQDLLPPNRYYDKETRPGRQC